MGDFVDLYPTLPNIIDVGGIKYYMLPGRPIQDIYKSRDEYLRTFGDIPDDERILRQYMGFSLQSKKRLTFDNPEDKQKLVNILKRRATQLQRSQEFSSSVLKNTIFQRSYLNIQKIIEDIGGGRLSNKSADAIKSEENDKCIKAKTAIKGIPEDRLFFILLEIAWYLLHPDSIPKDIQCSWAELIQGLDTLRLRGIVDQIKSTAPSNDGTPVNYFTKAGLGEIKKSKATNALEMINEFVKKMDGDDANKAMKDRLEILVKVLQMKKYIDDTSPINTGTEKSLTNSLITNPMRGGAGVGANRVDRPLGQALMPFFDYFKVVFDPVYTFLETQLLAKVSNANGSIKSATIPQLVTLLHICNNLKPAETPGVDQNSYGMYRITNIGADILGFFKNMLSHTAGYINDKLSDPKDVSHFGAQLFKLPKVRLTSLIDGDALYKDPDTIPYTRFLVLDTNFKLKESGSDTENAKAFKDFFKPEDLYILCTSSKNNETIDTDIPMNLYTIDFEGVNVTETGLTNIVPLKDHDTDTKEAAGGAGGKTDTLNEFIDITPGVVYNEAELALSIFILFKQLMPK
jgi:hypothetical protein